MVEGGRVWRIKWWRVGGFGIYSGGGVGGFGGQSGGGWEGLADKVVKEGESVWWTKWWWGERNIHRMHACVVVCVGVSVELSALHTRHSLHTYIRSCRVHIHTYTYICVQ